MKREFGGGAFWGWLLASLLLSFVHAAGAVSAPHEYFTNPSGHVAGYYGPWRDISPSAEALHVPFSEQLHSGGVGRSEGEKTSLMRGLMSAVLWGLRSLSSSRCGAGLVCESVITSPSWHTLSSATSGASCVRLWHYLWMVGLPDTGVLQFETALADVLG